MKNGYENNWTFLAKVLPNGHSDKRWTPCIHTEDILERKHIPHSFKPPYCSCLILQVMGVRKSHYVRHKGGRVQNSVDVPLLTLCDNLGKLRKEKNQWRCGFSAVLTTNGDILSNWSVSLVFLLSLLLIFFFFFFFFPECEWISISCHLT